MSVDFLTAGQLQPLVPASARSSVALGYSESRQTALAALGRRAMAASDVLLLMQDAASLLAETFNAPLSCVAELLPERDRISDPPHRGWQRSPAIVRRCNIAEHLVTSICSSAETDCDGPKSG